MRWTRGRRRMRDGVEMERGQKVKIFIWLCSGIKRKISLSWCVGPVGNGSIWCLLHHGNGAAEQCSPLQPHTARRMFKQTKKIIYFSALRFHLCVCVCVCVCAGRERGGGGADEGTHPH